MQNFAVHYQIHQYIYIYQRRQDEHRFIECSGDAARHVAGANQASPEPEQRHGDDDYDFDATVGGDVSCCVS